MIAPVAHMQKDVCKLNPCPESASQAQNAVAAAESAQNGGLERDFVSLVQDTNTKKRRVRLHGNAMHRLAKDSIHAIPFDDGGAHFRPSALRDRQRRASGAEA